eukprot:CAMPEP_0170509918 /NCGR_PEP_ID=MMETSP0208-20121228/65478_1 /TAXON_ID=197538 /ORGANISM="Strombidium inclinatum, Strain S3" /LENGTH=298 /DNA_ID=CAMNT_0010793323 /DNA_START=650 /DNA_END=1545 /DNA_ORIENTATION=-
MLWGGVLVVGQAPIVGLVPLVLLDGLAGVDEGVLWESSLADILVEVLHPDDVGLVGLDEGLVEVLHVEEPIQHVVLVVELPLHLIFLQEPEDSFLGSTLLATAFPGVGYAVGGSAVHEHPVRICRAWVAAEVSVEASELFGQRCDNRHLLGVPHCEFIGSQVLVEVADRIIREAGHRRLPGSGGMGNTGVVLMALHVRGALVLMLVVRLAAENLFRCFLVAVLRVIADVLCFVIYAVLPEEGVSNQFGVAFAPIESFDPFVSPGSTSRHPSEDMVERSVFHHEDDHLLDGVLVLELLG